MSYIDHIVFDETQQEIISRPIANSIADTYSSSKSYIIGDLVMYEGQLYRCKIAKNAGEWDSTKFEIYQIEDAIKEAVVVDSTLTIPGQAADAKKVGDEITDLKGDLNEMVKFVPQTLTDSQKAQVRENLGIQAIDGITEEVKVALLACVRNLAWSGSVDGQEYYNALETALYGSSNYPKIIATFNENSRTVYNKDNVNTLKLNLIVTYYESESDEGTILNSNDYTLNGDLMIGDNTITVLYNDLNTIFRVNAKETKYSYKKSLGEVVLKNGLAAGDGSQPLPRLGTEYSTTRRTVTSENGYVEIGNGNGGVNNGVFFIPVPGDATTIRASVTPSSMYVTIQMWTVNSYSNRGYVAPETGWKQGSASNTWSASTALRFAVINIKANSSGTSFTTEPSEVTVDFS